MRWMILEPIIQSEVSQKEKHQYSILTYIYIYMEFRKMAKWALESITMNKDSGCDGIPVELFQILENML